MCIIIPSHESCTYTYIYQNGRQSKTSQQRKMEASSFADSPLETLLRDESLVGGRGGGASAACNNICLTCSPADLPFERKRQDKSRDLLLTEPRRIKSPCSCPTKPPIRLGVRKPHGHRSQKQRTISSTEYKALLLMQSFQPSTVWVNRFTDRRVKRPTDRQLTDQATFLTETFSAFNPNCS